MCEIGHIYLKGMIPNTELTQPATLVIKATQVTKLYFQIATALSSQWTKNVNKNIQNSTNLNPFFSLRATRGRTKTVLLIRLFDIHLY
jgi:hypothetical protein